jgi:hypothetical protein
MARTTLTISLAAAVSLLAACQTKSPTDTVKSAGSAVVDGAKTVASAGTSLVNVNLSNVLNDLALDLKIDKANIPVNAQIPITIAANICGVNINILSVSTGGNSKGCTATTTSPELAQTVQQQIAAGGSVGGGGQATTGTTGTTGTAGAGTSAGTATGTAPTTQPDAQPPTTQPPTGGNPTNQWRDS